MRLVLLWFLLGTFKLPAAAGPFLDLSAEPPEQTWQKGTRSPNSGINQHLFLVGLTRIY